MSRALMILALIWVVGVLVTSVAAIFLLAAITKATVLGGWACTISSVALFSACLTNWREVKG